MLSIVLNFTMINGQNYCGFENEVNNLGIGIVECPETFIVYKDSLLKDTIAKINLYETDLNKYNICGKFSKPDYGILHLVCLHQDSKFYKVMINTKDFAFIAKTNGLIFKTWSEYLLSVYGLGRNHTAIGDFKKQSVLRDISNQLDTLTIPKGIESFCPIEIKGDWIKIQYDCDNTEGISCLKKKQNCESPLIGWIRWRKDNRFLIDIYLLP